MHTPASKLLVFVMAALAFAPLARAQMSPVNIRVETVSKSDSDAKTHTKTTKRSLKIHVSNNGQAPLELVVKYTLFGRELDGKEIVAVDSGEKPASMKARTTEIVETTAATASMTEAHAAKNKKVEASGTKFIGYGVQVLSGDKVVAEAYEPASMKESWGKVTVAKPAAKTPAKPAAKK